MRMFDPGYAPRLTELYSKNICYLIILVIILLIYGVDDSLCCSELFVNHLGTTSSDQIVKEGDPVDINCTLFTSTLKLAEGRSVDIDSKMLILKYNGTRIQNSKLHIFDNFTVQYKVKRTSRKENGYYMCYLDIGIYNVKPRTVCASYVTIGRSPSEGDNFSLKCSGNDFKNFTCTWDTQDYNVATEYNLTMMVHNHDYSICPRQKKNSCTFSIKDSSPYLISDKKLKFRLDVSNRFGSTYRIFEIDHYSNVILSPITKIDFNSVGAQNVLISWDPPKSIRDDPYLESITEYQLKISLDENVEVDDDYEINSGKPVVISIKGWNVSNVYKVSNLTPYTSYVFAIKCRLVTDFGNGPWSLEFNNSTSTRPDVPYQYPKLPYGGYEITNDYEDRRDIRVYFDPISELETNGPNFTYVLKINPVHISTSSLASNSSLSSILSSSTSMTKIESAESSRTLFMTFDISNVLVENLNSSKDYVLEIFSQNAIGMSSGYSRTIIPSKEAAEVNVDHIYGINWADGNYSVFWSVSSTDLIASYNIFWCESNDIDETKPCFSKLHHVKIPGDQNSTNLYFSRDKFFGKFFKVKFGISVIQKTNNHPNAIKWSECVEDVSRLSVGNRFKQFDLVSSGADSIKVSWQFDCPSIGDLIKRLEIVFCQIDAACLETFNVIQVDKSLTDFTINKLKANTAYNFTLRGLTYEEDFLTSNTLTIETKMNYRTLIATIIVIIGTIIIVLCTVYSLFICAIRKRKDEKELKKAIDNNWIPKMPSRLKGDANILLNPLCHETRNEYENKEYMNADPNSYKFICNELNSKVSTMEKNNDIVLSTISNNQLNDILSSKISHSPLALSSILTSCSTSEGPDEDEMGVAISSKKDHMKKKRNLNISSSSLSISSSSSSSSPPKETVKKKERKSSEGFGCDSEDSGFSTRFSDKHPYYRACSFSISGIIRSTDTDSPYIVPDKLSGIPIEKVISNDCIKYNTNNDNDTNHSRNVTRSLSDSDISFNDNHNSMIFDDLSSLPLRNSYLPADDNYYNDNIHDQNEIDVATVSNGYVLV